MGQYEIIDLLMSNPGQQFTVKDISTKLNINENSVAKNLNRIQVKGIIKSRRDKKTIVEYEG